TCGMKIERGEHGYVLEDVPHLTDYIPNLNTHPNPMRFNPAYSVVNILSILMIPCQKRGVHFRRAGPRQQVYFSPDEVHACIVTCGGLCPGLNTVIREIVCALYHMYGVTRVLGIDGGYRGFYSKNTINLTPKVVNDIHKRGGTVLGSSRGGHDKSKIVDSIQDRGINQVYIIGGDGTQKGNIVNHSCVFVLRVSLGGPSCGGLEIKRRGIKVVVAGIPKTIDNDIAVIDKSFGFDTAEAQRAINAADVDAESAKNRIGVIKLMGRYSAEELVKSLLHKAIQQLHKMLLGTKYLKDVGMWLSDSIKAHFAKTKSMHITLKYIGEC
ncbi:ATP-dependent 6-phosphofructokinase 6-like protein, partial [Tanacetum coccineum]